MTAIASPLALFLIDEDPVFRLGLRIWLEQRSEFQVVGEAATATEAIQQIATIQRTAAETATDAAVAAPTPAIDLVILDIGLGQGSPDQIAGLALCGEIKQQFPQLMILVLSVRDEPVIQAAARQMGASGFGQRSLPVRELVRLIQQVAVGQDTLTDVAQDVAIPPPVEGPIAALRRSSCQQIDAAMTEIEQAATAPLPYWYRLVLAGKYRELRAARWVVQQLLREPGQTAAVPTAGASSPVRAGRDRPAPLPVPASGEALVNAPSPIPVAVNDVRSRVCEAVFRKLQFPLDNRSDMPLEIDILRTDKSRELLYTVLRSFEEQLDDLQQAQLPPGQLVEKAPTLLHDLWETVITDFFGRYYTPPIEGLEQPMVDALRQDAAIVQAAILNRIPQVPALLSHLLFQSSLEVEGAAYVATTPEALRRSQFLLENLLLQVACAVMQPVLDRFADVEFLKRSLYQRRILSTRDVTRFRNDLSWRYRWDEWVNTPKAVFESQYRLLALTPEGIRTHRIYAPRREELEALSGVQYALTLALEARDAIAPRLRTALSFIGSGAVFVLTEVIGRGIGLIGRGIFKGVGSAWQDSRFRQRQQDET